MVDPDVRWGRGALAALCLAGFLAVGCGDSSAPSSEPPQAGTQTAAEGQECGGFAGIQCADGLWCEHQAGECETADVSGTCVTVPEMCTKDYRPVCSCD